MTLISGLPPNNGASTGSNWRHTFVDRTVALPAGGNLTLFEVYSTTPRTFTAKVMREIAPDTYDVLFSQSLPHPGGGWFGVAPDAAYVIPASGVYRMAVHTPSDTSTSIAGQRATRIGNALGADQTDFYAMSAQVPPMRVTIDGSPSPQPPPPPEGEHYVVLVMGQSNAMNWGNNTAAIAEFTTRLQTVLNTSKPVVIVNAAVGGASIAAWAPGSSYYNAALSKWQAAITTPGALPAGAIWLQGEADSSVCTGAIKWDVSLKTILAALRTAIAQPTLPVVVTELFVNPDPVVRPYWDVIQRHQREVGALNALVSASDLVGSAADPIHLASADLVILGTRYADALAAKMGTP